MPGTTPCFSQAAAILFPDHAGKYPRNNPEEPQVQWKDPTDLPRAHLSPNTKNFFDIIYSSLCLDHGND
ncbi:MAG: hypothetical protein Ct9H300mP19_05400 [Dehalococcoidia bacterium]|nr:MAG: hypothetical protein Ct9H300mP19_05400 [Dehalococcoidia bacterium]